MNDDFQQPQQQLQQPLPAEPEPIAPPMPGQIISGSPNVSNGPISPADPVGPSNPMPQPGPVVSGGSMPPMPAGPPPSNPVPPMPGGPMAPASAPPSGGGKRWLKIVIFILVLILIAAGGWFAYQKLVAKKSAGKTTIKHSDVANLNIGILNADYGSLYPNMSTSSYAYLVNAQMFDGLVKYQNQGKIVPDLATKWSNPDSSTWLFTIQNGVKFHDGHTLTPADVKYSLDAVKASNSDLAQTFTDTIASVDTVGDNQIKITTSKPDPALLNKLTFLYVIDHNLPASDEPSQAGTGPYEIKSGTTPSATSVQMTAFNSYFGGRPTTAALNFGSAADSDALISGLNDGSYDIAGPVSLSQAKAETNATQFITSQPDVYYVGFNTVKTGPLQNKKVREAIRYALSAQSIGNAHNTQITPNSQLVPSTLAGYDPSIKPYKQDVAKAKKLLAEAGYSNGLPLTLSTAESPQATNEIVKELKSVGITATVDQHADFNQFVSSFNSGQDAMFVVDYGSNFMDAGDIYANTLVSANYSSSKLADLLTQASTETDQSQRQKLLQSAGKVVDQDIAAVSLYTINDIWLMNKPYVIKQDLPNAGISANFLRVQQ